MNMNTPEQTVADNTTQETNNTIDEQESTDMTEIERQSNRDIDLLNIYATSNNIAESLDEKTLNEIGNAVVTEYKIDKDSRSQWEKDSAKWMELAKPITEIKEFPWHNAANIKYPLISKAAIQFVARAYPTIISEPQIVKGRVIGKDETGEKASRAQRIAEHMSYQLMEEMDGWEEDTDHLLTYMAIMGLAYRKTYHDTLTNKNVSEYCSGENVVVHYWSPPLERTPRITQKYELYPNEIEEMKRAGIYLDIDLGTANATDKHNTDDKDSPHIFLEQHRWWDLDGDSYKEPYIITVHEQTEKVVRIVARYNYDGIIYDDKGNIVRIEPIEYFTKFEFIPSFDNSFYPIGFGFLLGPGNEIINSTINQLLDAGTNANTGGGLIDGRIVPKGRTTLAFTPGEYIVTAVNMDDIQKGIWNRPIHEPSLVTFQLLGTMIEANDRLASMSELMTGGSPVANTPATTSMASIEQSMKLYSAINKRIYRALKSEFKKLYKLNKWYLSDEEYYTVLDNQKAIARKDYDYNDCDIVPSGNPADTTDTMRLLKAQALIDVPNVGRLDQDEILKRFLEALNIPEPEKLFSKQEPTPDPAVELKMKELDIKQQEIELEKERIGLEAIKTKADAIKALAEAESKEVGIQIENYKAQIKALEAENDERKITSEAKE